MLDIYKTLSSRPDLRIGGLKKNAMVSANKTTGY